MGRISRCITYCKRQALNQTRKHGGSFKKNLADCKLLSCNPTCKNTSFGLKILSPAQSRSSQYKAGHNWRKTFRAKRRALFGRKRNIMDNGFYLGSSNKRNKSLRAQGAISGCHEDF